MLVPRERRTRTLATATRSCDREPLGLRAKPDRWRRLADWIESGDPDVARSIEGVAATDFTALIEGAIGTVKQQSPQREIQVFRETQDLRAPNKTSEA